MEKQGVAVEVVSFATIKHAVAKQFEMMKGHPLFRINLADASLPPEMRRAATGDKLWETYLASFPAGTNPIYRERAEHDCSCCRHFVKHMGGVVCVVEGRLISIWDLPIWDFEGAAHVDFYRNVAAAMQTLVTNATIDNIFLTTETSIGVDKNFEQLVNALNNEAVKTWEHFHLHMPAACVTDKATIGPKESEALATHDVLKRGLEELTLDSIDTVLELIAQNSLYRGEEYRGLLNGFRKVKVEFDREQLLRERSLRVWSWSRTTPPATARIRNVSIGTLLIDLSAGLALEDAVKKFETSIMAPSNYKRPTALVSKAMIAKAQQQIEELGLTSALERRYAHLDDITVNNILFADRTTTKLSKNVFDDLTARIPESSKTLDRVEDITIDKLLELLRSTESLELMLENRHVNNLVSLVAPVDPGAKHLFKWPNNFSWSYNGDVTDSIKERVKKAGGSITGDLCCRLAWDYTDDLDFHMQEPGTVESRRGFSTGTFNHIYFPHRGLLSANGGMLDVDANGASGMMKDPVENIFYRTKAKMRDGIYKLFVHNYSRRSDGVGFEAELEFPGATLSLVYDRAMHTGQQIEVAQIQYSKAEGFKVLSSLPSTQTTKTMWGVQTQTFRRVNVVMLSPNYWQPSEFIARPGESYVYPGIGNKHHMFMLDGCVNEGTARGIYNEFLSAEMEPHRKVMEMVGARMKTDTAARQLSGVGFSSTQHSSVLCRLKGSFTRIVRVNF